MQNNKDMLTNQGKQLLYTMLEQGRLRSQLLTYTSLKLN